MERDNSVLGCGDGDVEKILTTGVLKGKCTDINSVFVALARAAGIPAREIFWYSLRYGREKWANIQKVPSVVQMNKAS